MRLRGKSRIGGYLTLSLLFLLPAGAAVAIPGTASASAPAVLCNGEATGSWSNNCTVSKGSTGGLVIGVQQVINGFGSCGEIAVDGDFGPMTDTAVRCWQSAHSLANDGMVGPLTWGAMQGSLHNRGRSGDWALWSSYPAAGTHNFQQWVPTGAWYVANASGTFVRM
jgi:peptidoglycan hydrolase-like protein with peptidoglycan-binding domain